MTPNANSPLIRKTDNESLVDLESIDDDDEQRSGFSSFILMSILFSAFHGTVVSCLDLVSSILYD